MLTGYISPYPYTELLSGLFTVEFADFAVYSLNCIDDRPGIWEYRRAGKLADIPVCRVYKTLLPGAYIQSAHHTLQ